MFIGSEILAPDLVWQDLGDLDPNYFQTLKAGRWERERETSACIRISCNLEKYHEWVLKSFSCASAFARQSRIFDGIDALYAFYRIPKSLQIDEIFFPEFHLDLIWIQTLTTFFSFLRERGSKYH